MASEKYDKDYQRFLSDQLKRFQSLKKLNEDEIIEISPTAALPDNINKNRYNDVLAIENTLVSSNSSSESEYINANHVWGRGSKPECSRFIATQGPMAHTINTFWSMIFYQRSKTIVMLTNLFESGRFKCNLYWPVKTNSPHEYGQVQVTLLSLENNQHFVHRRFKIELLNSEEEPFEVDQYHYGKWADHGVPNTTDGIREILSKIQDADGPVTVHCSAGIGRTGVFIAIRFLLQEIKDDTVTIEDLDPVEMVKIMRTQRTGVVQTDEQFVFILRFLQERINELKGEPSAEITSRRQLSTTIGFERSGDLVSHGKKEGECNDVLMMS